jgi:hypothetical protein
MKASMIKWFGTLVAGLFAVLAAPASAQLSTTANGPYYATPSWDQKLTTNRFVILLNWNSEAVLDRETGLVWERTPDATHRAWSLARAHCINRVVGGRKGWRLPSIQELLSLVDPTVAPPGPTLPAGHPFPTGLAAYYWSASSGNPVDSAAYTVFLNIGVAVNTARSAEVGAWCVRGAQEPDPQ